MLTKQEQYQKCFNEGYLESCKIAKKITDHPLNNCDNMDCAAQTRFNVTLHCQQKVGYKSFSPIKHSDK